MRKKNGDGIGEDGREIIKRGKAIYPIEWIKISNWL